MLIAVAAVAGLILGSFLSVLVERWPSHAGIITGRSRCPDCRHTLAWHDLVPVFSWLWLRGSCRYCKRVITPRYLSYELVTAGVFSAYAIRATQPTLGIILDFGILFCLVSLLFFDLRWQILPDWILGALAVVGVTRLVLLHQPLINSSVAATIGMGVLFDALFMISRGRWLGLGDVKMALPIGILFGWPGACMVTMVAVWLGAIVAIGLLLTRRATMKTALPFGSFWAAAGIFATIVPMPILFLK